MQYNVISEQITKRGTLKINDHALTGLNKKEEKTAASLSVFLMCHVQSCADSTKNGQYLYFL